MIIDVGIDRRRVFVVGLSAGGAMASAMLAVYPDVFAGGAIIAGLPFASATNVQEAFEVMAKGRERAGPQWGGDGPGRCGNASAFHFDVGTSSSHHIARFWGLAERQPVVDDRVAERRSALPVPAVRTSEIPTLAAREASAGNSVDGDQTGAFAFPDPREAITAALKAAGL